MDIKPTPVQLQTKKLSPPAAEAAPAPVTMDQATNPVPVDDIEKKVYETLKTCYDPEIPVNIHELGLIYGVAVNPAGAVHVRMTLTTPACPAAESLPPEVEGKIKAIPGV